MLEKILNYIDDNKDDAVAELQKLISLVSSDGRETAAQTIVENELKNLGFATETFREDERAIQQPDYSPYTGFTYDEGAYNVAGRLMGNGNVPSMMLFAHIDTEAENYFGKFENPYESYVKDGKIYGLGASDDKGGVAMMLCAVKYLKKYVPELPYDLTVMSIMGKHGGGFGTMSALMKGYTGDNSIYLHPAETGHGFGEIKNISLGIIDIDISVKGKGGILHDDLSTGENASVKIAQIVCWLEEYNRIMRDKYRFDFGSFKGQPSFILNTGTIKADGGYGGINKSASMNARVRFYLPLTIDSVIDGVKEYLKQKCSETGAFDFGDITIEKGPFRATPCIVPTESPFVKLIEDNITDVTGIKEFTHQYHGGSDIRFPIVYGSSQCVGIGPYCELPEKGSGKMEWISTDDYINGIKILVSILYRYMDYGK